MMTDWQELDTELAPPTSVASAVGAPAPSVAAELLTALPTPLLHVGADGLVRWANPAALALLGAAAAPGRPLAALWSPVPEAAALAAALQCAAEGEVVAAELPLRRPGAGAHKVRASGRRLAGGGAVLSLQGADELHAAQAEVHRLSELLDLARDFGRLGVWERNVRTLEGRWDPQVHRFWGLDPEAPTPDFKAATARVADTDRGALERYFGESLLRPGRYATRYRVRGADGTMRRIHSQWIVKPGPAGEPERVLGLMMDDSEPFRLAHTQSELESQLALAVDLGDIAVWRHDLATDGVRLNSRAFRILGLPPRDDEVPMAEVAAIIHPDDLPRAAASAREALTSVQPLDLELRYRRSEGGYRTVMTRRVAQRNAAGRVVAFVGVGLDVTERHRTEQALRSASERAALAARGAGLGTWEVDLRSGETFWDEQMWLLRGRKPRARAMDSSERLACVHPDDRARFTSRLSVALAAGESCEHDFRIVWPDGRVRWLASRSVVLHDGSGGARRIGVNWDVTDSRAAEAVLHEREIALRESQAKSKFLARMSHELRTPLNAVLGFAQLLRADERGNDAAAAARRDRLDHIRNAGQHLLGLIDDVLELTSVEGGELRVEMQPVALAPLVAQTLPLVEPLARSMAVRLHAEATDLHVHGDARRLRQVLLNLLSNAVKYNRRGGDVWVEVRTEGDSVVLAVTDTGCGITEAQQRHLFEPFNRLGAEGGAVEGTGIGLAIVKALTERMGGSVRVHSRPGIGSRFELQLDSAGTETAGAPAARRRDDGASVQTTPRPATRRRLLYVEDNPVNAIILRELLARRHDLELHVAADGASGVELAARLTPALILLDMQLPDCDGYEVLRRLRASPATARIPCIALSANAMPDDIQRALSAGMADYWTKPLDFQDFMAALDRIFGPAPDDTSRVAAGQPLPRAAA